MISRPSGKMSACTRSARSASSSPQPREISHTATPDDVKILMTNDLRLSAVRGDRVRSPPRRQIELFFKELKSTLGFHQYQFQKFQRAEERAELC